MKDADESGKISYGLIYGGLIKRHPMIYNAVLVISIIALTAVAAFLVSDILSFNSDNAPAGLSGASSFLSPTKSEQIESPDMATTNNTSLKKEGTSPSSLNKSKINESGTEKRISYRNGDSDKSSKKKKHKSSKNSNQTKTGTSSPITAVKSSSELNLSQENMSINADKSDNVSMNLSNASATPAPASGSSNYGASANLAPAEKQLGATNLSQSNTPDIVTSGTQDLRVGSPTDRGDDAVVIPMMPVSPVPSVSTPPISTPPVSNPDEDIHSDSESPAEDIAAPVEPPVEASPEEEISSSSSQAKEESAIKENSAVQEDSQSQENTQVAPSGKFSSRSRDAQEDQINKKSRAVKNLKRTTPSVKPVKTKPVRPSRDRSAN